MGVQLKGCVVPRIEVDDVTKNRLYCLWKTYYQNVDRLMFEQDIAEKDWVLLLSDAEGIVRGFTTLKYYDLTISGRRIRAIFNGSTIIDKDYWGDQELVRTWCRFMAELKREEPGVPLYWYLIVSGFRTYMFLPLFYKHFYPNHAAETPAMEQEIIDTLGRKKFPDEFRDGVVHVSHPREILDHAIAVPKEHKLRNPNIRFFVERNPGYLRGDELVCLTEFSIENTKRMAHEIAVEVLGSVTSEPFVRWMSRTSRLSELVSALRSAGASRSAFARNHRPSGSRPSR